MKLILFDIDGTLIRSNSAGRIALQQALQAVFGTSGPLADYQFGGKTDARIVTDLMSAAGVPAETIADQLPAVYAMMAEKARTVYPQKQITQCAGISRLLPLLDQHPDILLGLLTGNAAETAVLKLQAAGINPNQFQLGAYGSDSLDRNHLPGLAMARARDLNGHSFTGDNTVIIGDTPADILCARAGQAMAVAVASGWHAAATLARYQPDHLLDDLSNTEQIFSILLANSQGIQAHE